tara:strand:- start:4622 stop:5206 length:585 start_codon:yes stop_codon:yes gene_type:complete
VINKIENDINNIFDFITTMSYIIDNPVEFRDNIRKKLKVFIKNNKHSINLEKAVFNYSIKESKNRKIVRKWDNKYFVQIYLDRFRSIYNNMNPKMTTFNKDLLNKFKKNKIQSKQLACMTHQEMNPKIWKELIDAKIKRDKNLTQVDMSAATDEFKCFKCQKRQCTYYQLQTRSADEPMTTFITCLNCGNRWKN